LRGKEGTPESKKEDFKKIAEAAKAKIDAVLTPEQKATLDAMKKKHGKGLGGEKGPKDDKKGPPPVES
jgi:Spy/CpxP family protein refolding chaperone